MKDMACRRWVFNTWIIDIPKVENKTKGNFEKAQ